MLTKNGVSYNLAITPFYTVKNGLRFHFSSRSHKMKFDTQVRVKEEWLRDSFYKRFHFLIDTDLIADLQLYSKIEQRGFYVIDLSDGGVFDCLESVELDGLQANKRDLRTSSENTMQQLLE